MGYIDVSYEVVSFGLAILLGGILCLLYDVVRVLHKFYIKGFFEVLVCDVLFWLIASALTFCFLIIRCLGYVRGYVLFGELVGAILVRFSLSRLWFYILGKIFGVFVAVFSHISLSVHKFFQTCGNFVKKISKTLKKVLQHKRRLLYNHLKVRTKDK